MFKTFDIQKLPFSRFSVVQQSFNVNKAFHCRYTALFQNLICLSSNRWAYCWNYSTWLQVTNDHLYEYVLHFISSTHAMDSLLILSLEKAHGNEDSFHLINVIASMCLVHKSNNVWQMCLSILRPLCVLCVVHCGNVLTILVYLWAKTSAKCVCVICGCGGVSLSQVYDNNMWINEYYPMGNGIVRFWLVWVLILLSLHICCLLPMLIAGFLPFLHVLIWQIDKT